MHWQIITSNSAQLIYRLLPHCSEQVLLSHDALDWRAVFAGLNLDLEIKNLGCCGMAGSYRHMREHEHNSTQLFAMHWQAVLEDSSRINLATGFNCRSHANKYQHRLAHSIEIINQALLNQRNN